MKIYPLTLNSLLVDYRQLEASTYRISRSNSPEGPFEIIEATTHLPYFIDEHVNLHKVGLRYHYKVEGLEGGIVTTEEIDTMQYGVMDGVANKIVHEERVILRVMNNPDVFVLIKHRASRECEACFNPITNKPKFSNCKNCNGTGYTQGYHKPVRAKISRDFSQIMNYVSVVDGEKSLQSGVSAWITNHPMIEVNDIIVDCLNNRFRVDAVMPRMRSQVLIRQIIQLIPLEKGHPAHLMEVPIDELRK